MLRLQLAAEPAQDQLAAESAVLDRLAIAYRRYRPAIVSIEYQQRLRTNLRNMGGRGYYAFLPAIFFAIGGWRVNRLSLSFVKLPKYKITFPGRNVKNSVWFGILVTEYNW